jgi:uncharacterized membrane protein
MSTTEFALFFHILGAMLFVAGIVVAGVAFEAARGRSEPGDIAVLLGLTRAGVLLVGVGATLVLGFGLWLVSLTGVGYGAGWVDAALALYFLAMGLGGMGGQGPRRARLLAARLAAERQPANAELRALLDDRRSLIINYVSALAVLAILVLMVFKP